MRLAGNVARTWEKRNRPTCKVLVGKYEGKRPLGRSRRRNEDNIKMFNVRVSLHRVITIDNQQDATILIYLLIISST